MRDNRYTQQEIDSSINKLNNNLEELKNQKIGINNRIKDIKNNIKFYEDLDCSQIKIF